MKGRTVWTFDTGVIGRGLLSYSRRTGDKAALRAALAAGEFLEFMQLPNGAMFPMFNESRRTHLATDSTWATGFTTILCKCSEFLLELEHTTAESKWRKMALALGEWTLAQPQLDLTHPGAYALEGLLALGRHREVKSRLESVFLPRLSANGFISYGPGLSYAYVSGSVQLGILLAKTGYRIEAERIHTWASLVQRHGWYGGLPQYANPDGTVNSEVHSEVNSWGTKYYAELETILLA